MVILNKMTEIKNKLLKLSYEEGQYCHYDSQEVDCLELYEDIINFNKNYKRKPKKYRRIPNKASESK